MDALQLPDVDSLLVRADNPARADLSGMDHARCAALHNYLVHYAWAAEGRPPASLHGNNTFFTTHGAAAEALRSRLDPSLAAFLDTAMMPPPDAPEPPPLFFWAAELSDPDDLFANDTVDLYDEPEDSLVCLYFPNIGQGGEFGGGLYYHQGSHRAAVFMHMDDHDYALPAEVHRELWHPLETVLSNWIELLRLGKVTASPRAEPALFGSEKIGPWEWRPYSEAQVAACLGSWDRLCGAIEARISPSPAITTTTTDAAGEPLLVPAALDAASVPGECFAGEFLTRARRPRFRCIAPGLLLPPADAHEFAAAQPFTGLPRAPRAIPPVRLFFTAGGEREADLAGSSPFCKGFRAGSANSPVPSRVPAGVYSESVERDLFDNAEEGFRLLLPFGLEGDATDGIAGARLSDGSCVGRGTAAELFQHGYKPFGGGHNRAQRLERLLDHWHKLVDEGVWTVGAQGVEGTIDTFRTVDTVRWRDYRISPTCRRLRLASAVLPLQPGVFQRRLTTAGNETDSDAGSSPRMDGPAVVCHVEARPQDGGRPASHADADLDYDNLLFIDMDGNLVDGRTCGVIYEDRPDSQVRIVVDEDGNVVDMYMGDDDAAGLWHGDAPESPVTATEPVIIVTATTGAARPPSEPSPTFPASTTVSATRMGSVVTLAPF